MKTITIEGIDYEPIKRNHIHTDKNLFMLTAMAAMFGTVPMPAPRKRPDVDIIEEYKLILQKKSNLSKSDRNWVISQFKSNFKPVKK